MKVLITGGTGQLGRELIREFSRENVVEAPERGRLDITDWQVVKDYMASFKPALVIHSAALTDVDRCELEERLAYRVNSLGTQSIAAACQRSGAEMVYLSSDYVFTGKKEGCYLEFDRPGPLNAYGKSKLAGEDYVKGLLGRHYIVRTAWLYGVGKNFIGTMLRLAGERDYLEVVDDQVGTPTSARELARVLFKLTGTGLYGTYHASNNGSCSRYQFAREVFALLKREIEIRPVNSSRFNFPARRPARAVLANFVLENQGIYLMRPWEEALEEYLNTGGATFN